MRFQAACNRAEQSCGCLSWDQWESGVWVRKRFLCNTHEVAAWIAAKGRGVMSC